LVPFALAFAHGDMAVNLGYNGLVIAGGFLFFDKGDHFFYLAVGDIAALYADGLGSAYGIKQHIAAPQQLFRATPI
jgi:hypothetical protein